MKASLPSRVTFQLLLSEKHSVETSTIALSFASLFSSLKTSKNSSPTIMPVFLFDSSLVFKCCTWLLAGFWLCRVKFLMLGNMEVITGCSSLNDVTSHFCYEYGKTGVCSFLLLIKLISSSSKVMSLGGFCTPSTKFHCGSPSSTQGDLTYMYTRWKQQHACIFCYLLNTLIQKVQLTAGCKDLINIP